MKYSEWQQLDDLLSKEGFGGYYDLVECIKDSTVSIAKKLEMGEKVIDAIYEVKNLKKAIAFLQAVADNRKLKDKG